MRYAGDHARRVSGFGATKLTLDANGNNAQSDDFDPDNIVQWGTSIFWYRPGFLTALGAE